MEGRAIWTRHLPSLALALLCSAAFSGAAELRGRVSDPAGQPAERVLVSIPELALSTVSDAGGAFVLEGVPEGSYVLLCEGAGLVPTRLPVSVPSSAPVQVVVMSAASIKKGGTGEIAESRGGPAEGAGGEVTAADAGGVKVQLLCTNCNAASLSMLGLSDKHMEMRLDGVPVLEGIHAVWALSMLPQAAIAKTLMVPGPGSVFSGSAGLAGTMDLITVDPFDGAGGRFEISRGSYDLWSESLYGRGQITENLYADAAVTHSTSNRISPDDDDRYEQGDLDRETLMARLHYRINDRSRLRLGFIGYHEDQWAAPGTYVEAREYFLNENVPIERREIHGNWSYDFDNGAYIKAVGMLSNRDQAIYEEEYNRSTPRPTWPMVEIYDIESDWEYLKVESGGFVGTRLMLQGGLVHSREVMDVHDIGARFIGNPEYIHDTVNQKAAYLQSTWTLPHQVELLLGARYDDFDAFGSQFSPRLGIRWKPTHGLYVNFGLGESYRPPRPVFEEVCCGNKYQSNSGLLAEEGRAAHLSISWYPSNRLKFTLAGLYSDFDDYIAHFVTGHTGLNGIYQDVNMDGARIKGGEFGFQVKFDHLSLGGSYGLVDTEFDGDVYGWDRVNQIFYLVLPDTSPLPDVTEETGSLFVTWTGSRWNANLQADYFGDQYIQVLTDDVFDETVVPELRPIETYWSLNARVSRTYKMVEFYGGVDNMLDEYQEDFADYRTSAKWGLQRGRYFYAGVGWDF